MTTRSLSLSLLALATASTLVACSSDDAETPGQSASGSPSTGASTAPSTAPSAGGSSAPAATADGEAVVDADAVLEIDDQVSEGPTVNVKAAAVTTGGWVVVAADGGRNILGAGEVPAGASAQLVQVSLAEIITEETELEARLYADTNPDGFYGAGDRPVTNDDADDDDAPASFAGELEVFSFRGADVVNQ